MSRAQGTDGQPGLVQSPEDRDCGASPSSEAPLLPRSRPVAPPALRPPESPESAATLRGHTPSAVHPAATDRHVQEMADALQDAEFECEALWMENEALKAERENSLSALERGQSLLAQRQHELEFARHVIHTMESTRGWRLLRVLRRCRDALRLSRPSRRGQGSAQSP